MSEVNVVCMKWGNVFAPKYVNNLYEGVKRNLTFPFKFHCFTEDSKGLNPNIIVHPLPELYIPEKNRVSPWLKLAMFSKELGGLSGKTLFLDLDNIIMDNIDCFFTYNDKFSIVENWTQKGQGIGNSTVYCFEFGKYSFILDKFKENPEKICNEFDNEQIFLSKQLGNELAFYPSEWCKSFKRHSTKRDFRRLFVEPKFPKNTKILAFHGNPRPHEALEGRWPGKLIPFMRKPKWLSEYWR